MDIFCVYDDKIIRKNIKKIKSNTINFKIKLNPNELFHKVKLYDYPNEYDINYSVNNDIITINDTINKSYIIIEYISNIITWSSYMKIYIRNNDILCKLYAHFNINDDDINFDKLYKELHLYNNYDKYVYNNININHNTVITLNESCVIKNKCNYHIYKSNHIFNKYNCIVNFNIPECKISIFDENVDMINEINTSFLEKNIKFSFIGDINDDINIFYYNNYETIEFINKTDDSIKLLIEFNNDIDLSSIELINVNKLEIYEKYDNYTIFELTL